MNPKGKPSKVVRVSVDLFDELSEIGSKFDVSKRDVIDALIEDFLMGCKKKDGRNLKFRVFKCFMERKNVRKRKPPTKREPDGGLGERDDTPSVPDWMK